MCLLSVGLLDRMTGHEPVCVRGARGLHGGRARPQLREDGPIAPFIANVVALEYRTAFVFAPFVIDVQLVVLFDHNAEHEADVDIASSTSGLAAHVRPIADSLLVPDALVAVRTLNLAKAIPTRSA